MNAPTIEIALDSQGWITGWVTQSADPNDDNVGFWVATEEVIKNWGYTVTAKKVPPQGTNAKEVISRSVPERYHLSQNHPNPFNAETTIRFDLPKSSSLSLIIYDITGRKIKTLVNQNLLAGSHQIKWHGKDEYGRNVTLGVYVYEMTSQEMSFTKKALLIK